MVSGNHIKYSPQQKILKTSEIWPQMKCKFTKIRWEDALNVAKSAANESEGARQVQITMQLEKLN